MQVRHIAFLQHSSAFDFSSSVADLNCVYRVLLLPIDACSGTGLDSTVQPSPTGTLLSFINSSVADLTTQQKTYDLARYYFVSSNLFLQRIQPCSLSLLCIR